jgi:S1-C subfamily serine protease
MFKRFLAACVVVAATIANAHAAGPFGSIRSGTWIGGAFSDDNTGAFSHCGATSTFSNGVILVIGQNASNAWLLGFASPAFKLKKGETYPVIVTFDGQSEAKLFATAGSDIMLTSVMPLNVARTFQKSSLMVAVAGQTTLQFTLSANGPLLNMIANCVAKVKAEGLNGAGDFTKIASAAKPDTTTDAPSGASAAPAPQAPKSWSGTGFVVSASGHILTNNHVADGCSDLKGSLGGQPPTALRVVSRDETNDLAVLQGPAETFKNFVKIRDRAIHSGDSVVVIGYPYHGLLSSDFTVTTGIVSSLSGMRNDTRELQISAAVQPGNSGGPLLDMTGLIVGIVTAKLDVFRVARATGTIPENINFAIKTGAIRDFLDNSVVPYETAAPGSELKASDIANNARAYTLLITCNGAAQADNQKK